MSGSFSITGCRDDVQAIVGSGFLPLRHCRYGLLQVDDPAQAKATLRDLLDLGLVKSLTDLGRDEQDAQCRHRVREAVMLAFTYEGLRALGIREHDAFPFPTPFRSGMASDARARLLGDRNRAAWQWEDAIAAGSSAFRVHALLAHYRADPFPPDEHLPPPLRQSPPGFDARIVATCPSYIEPYVDDDGERTQRAYEPFGFRDGIAQPLIRELVSRRREKSRRLAGRLFADRLVAAGEFVLGHVNEYGERAYCPDAEGWPAAEIAAGVRSRFGMNGSYLAARQIRQHVQAFADYVGPHPKASEPPGVAEKMVGRRVDGRPLAVEPVPPAEADAFRFRVADFDGLQCPRGAHIRRANPRDMLGWDVASGVAMSKLHRLLRRGRVYAEGQYACGAAPDSACDQAGYRSSCGKGLLFLALNADLDRQFEFIQQRWIANPKFNDLHDEDDPLLGTAMPRAFTIQALPVGRRLQGFAPFTETFGGGYFFVPGLKALDFIAGRTR